MILIFKYYQSRDHVMVKIKMIMHGSKPVAVFLVEQQHEIEMLFYNYQIYWREFDISPAYMSKGNLIKIVQEKGDYILHVDKPENLLQYPYADVPFIMLGDGDVLLKVANSLDNRKMQIMDLEQKKKRRGLFEDDDDLDSGSRSLFGDDKELDDLPIFGKSDEPKEQKP